MVGQGLERAAQGFKLLELAIDLHDLFQGQSLHIRTGPLLVFIERKQRAAFINGEAEASGALNEGQAVNIVAVIIAIAIGGAG